MPIVPINYRADDAFVPLTDVDKIDKDDFAPAAVGAISTGRARVGTWLEFTGAGGLLQKPTGGAEVRKAAAPTWSDYDSAGLAGHPDSFRLGLITMLLGGHRGRTQYYIRQAVGFTGGFDPSIAAGDVGARLTVWGCTAADVALMTTGYGSAIAETGDGCLGIASQYTDPDTGGGGPGIVQPFVDSLALLLRGPDTNGYIEYLKY